MVCAFQDISSTEEDGAEEPESSVVQQSNVNVDVNIEITSDESERSEEEAVVSPAVQTQLKIDLVTVDKQETKRIAKDKVCFLFSFKIESLVIFMLRV